MTYTINANSEIVTDMIWVPAYVAEITVGDTVRYGTPSIGGTVLTSTMVESVARRWTDGGWFTWTDTDGIDHTSDPDDDIDIARLARPVR